MSQVPTRLYATSQGLLNKAGATFTSVRESLSGAHWSPPFPTNCDALALQQWFFRLCLRVWLALCYLRGPLIGRLRTCLNS